MSKRITELVNQVGADVSGKWVAVEKVNQLAHLIVDESIAVLQKRFMGDLNREDQEVQRCLEDLKRHFGVEE
jgi:hypothetical protein